MNVKDEETRVAAEVRSDHTAPRDKLPLTSTRVSPGVHHHLGPLVDGEVGVVEVPIRVGRTSKNIEALPLGIVASDADAGEPGFRHAQDIVFGVRGEKRMHGEVAPPHVDRKDGPYHH